MKIRTVLGTPLKRDYNLVLAHEHLIIDIRCWLDLRLETSGLRSVKVDDAETAARIRISNVFACADNLVLQSKQLAVEELSALASTDTTLLVDVTPTTIGRNIGALQEISQAAGVDIVSGCGPYIAASWPPRRGIVPRELVCEEILRDLECVPSSVVGEIGTSSPIHTGEREALAGAALAQKSVRAPLYVHLDPWGQEGHKALDIIEASGGDLSLTVLCHLDPHISRGLDYHRSLLGRGCLGAMDLWGDEAKYGSRVMPVDSDRAQATAALLEAGYGHQLLHSQDVCTKTQLKRFGGRGYAHMDSGVRTELSRVGLSRDDIQDQLTGNALQMFWRAQYGPGVERVLPNRASDSAAGSGSVLGK